MPLGTKTVTGGINAAPEMSREEAARLNRGLRMYRGITKAGGLEKATRNQLVVPLRHVNACAKPLWRAGEERQCARMPVRWKVRCLKCMQENVLEDIPRPLNRGWPKHKCTACRNEARLGAGYKCISCDGQIMHCKCTPVAGAQPPEISARAMRILHALNAGRAGGPAARTGDPSTGASSSGAAGARG